MSVVTPDSGTTGESSKASVYSAFSSKQSLTAAETRRSARMPETLQKNGEATVTVREVKPPTPEEIKAALLKRAQSGSDGGNSFSVFVGDADFEYAVEPEEVAGKKFRLSSMTKSLVAGALCKIMEKGKINLDDPVDRYLPCFKDMKVQEAAPSFNHKSQAWALYHAAFEALTSDDPDFIRPVDGRCPEFLAEYLARCYGLDWVDIEIRQPDGSTQKKKGYKKSTIAGVPAAEEISNIAGCRVELEACDKKITIRHLMTHTAGFGYGPGVKYSSPKSTTHYLYDQLCRKTEAKQITSLSEWVEHLAVIPLLFQPGTKREYSFGVDVVGRVLEVITGKKLDAIIRDEVLVPVGMSQTGWSVGSASELVPLYHRTRGGKQADDESEDEDEADGEKKKPTTREWKTETLEADGSEYVTPPLIMSGGGGIELVRGGMVGTLADFTKYARALVTGTFLKPDTLAQAAEINHLSIATNGKISTFRPGWGWNLFGALRVRFFANKKNEQWAEKVLANSYEWGGFAGTRFQIYPKVKGAFVFMRNAFGLTPLNSAFDIAVLEAKGAMHEEAVGAIRGPPRNSDSSKGKGKNSNWGGKGKGKGRKGGGNSARGGGRGGGRGAGSSEGKEGKSAEAKRPSGKKPKALPDGPLRPSVEA